MNTIKLKTGTFTGRIQKKRALKGFTLSTTHHDKNTKVPKHEHENPYISLLLHGFYHEQSILAENTLKPGSSLFRPEGFKHKNEIGPWDSFCFNVEIEKESFENQFFFKTNNFVQFEKNNIEIFKIYFGFKNNFSDELLALNLEENLHLLYRQKEFENTKGRALWVSKLMQNVRQNPEIKYSVNNVANSLDLHPNYFVRKFKSKVGFTFGEFLLRQRLSYALDLMLNSSKTLTEIALESGFYDQSHFIRHFKHFFNVTPYYYRKIIKG